MAQKLRNRAHVRPNHRPKNGYFGAPNGRLFGSCRRVQEKLQLVVRRGLNDRVVSRSQAMRLVTYSDGSATRAGVLVGEQVVPAEAAALDAGLDAQPRSVRMLLELLSAAQLARLGEAAPTARGAIDRAAVTLRAPVAHPEKIICLGLNYRDHAAETGQPIPQAPMWFAKFANSLIGDGQPVVLPAAHPSRVDYEAELAVVIGRRAREVSAGDALSFVAGAMPFNDVSARDLQLQTRCGRRVRPSTRSRRAGRRSS